MRDDERRLLNELAGVVEDFLRGSADAIARARRRVEMERAGPATVLAELLATLIEIGDGPILAALRRNLRAEVARWELRAKEDPAAARVRDLFAALLDVFAESAPAERGAQTPPRTPPRRNQRMS